MKFLNLYPHEMEEIESAQETEVAVKEAKKESNLKISISTLDFTKERNIAKVFLKKEINIIKTI